MSGLFGGGKEDPAAKAAMKIQKEQMERLSLPELEEYLLENPELVGLLEAEELGDSALEEISLDPATREAQLSALAGLKEYADEGITDTDKYAMEQMLGDVAAQSQSQQADIEADMARKGMDSSGASLMAKMNADQQGANNAREKAMQMAAQGSQNRMSALNQLAAQSGNMQQADYSRQANTASAKDAISRSNAANRQNVNQANLANRQSIENQRANIANVQSQVGNTIAQQNFNNAYQKAGGQGGVANQMSGIAAGAQSGPSVGGSALSGAAQGAAIGGPWGAAIGGGLGAISAMEDGGIVKNPCAEDGGYADGGDMYASNGMGEIIDSGMESFAGDRVDAKVNDGEMVINLPQQERLMGIIRGEESVDNLGGDDIVEGVPREFSEELHERSEVGQSDRVLGLERLIDMLGKE